LQNSVFLCALIHESLENLHIASLNYLLSTFDEYISLAKFANVFSLENLQLYGTNLLCLIYMKKNKAFGRCSIHCSGGFLMNNNNAFDR